LWLLRHADAEPHGTRADAERRLTERGGRQAEAAGLALARMGVSFSAVLTSPRARARETAELALAQLGADHSPGLELHEPLAGDFQASQALDAIAGVGREGPLL